MGLKWRFQWGWHGTEMGAIMGAGRGVVMRDGIEDSIGLKVFGMYFAMKS